MGLFTICLDFADSFAPVTLANCNPMQNEVVLGNGSLLILVAVEETEGSYQCTGYYNHEPLNSTTYNVSLSQASQGIIILAATKLYCTSSHHVTLEVALCICLNSVTQLQVGLVLTQSSLLMALLG